MFEFLRTHSHTVSEFVKDAPYMGKRAAAYASLKEVAMHEVAPAVTPAVTETLNNTLGRQAATNLSGLFSGMGGVAGLVMIGSAAAISAGLTQMDFHHRKTRLVGRYREELASLLKKPAGKITISDLETVAKENHTIGDEIRQARKQRNVGIGLSFMASMASLAVVLFAVPALLGSMGLVAASFSLAGAGSMAISMGIGLATYHAVKDPLYWIGDKIFDLNRKTTHQRIVEVKRDHDMGKSISREQVASVFVSAHQELNEFVTEKYGRRFDKLALAEKHDVAEELSKIVPLEQIARDINSGKVNPTELAFAVEGQISGVQHTHREPKKRGMLGAAWDKFRQTFTYKSPAPAAVAASPAQAPARAVVEYDNGRPGHSFVQQHGLAKKDPSLGFAEQIKSEPAHGSEISPT